MLFVAAAMTVAAAVKPGVEVLRDNGFKQLAGKRVGLITNPTGIDNNLKSTVDILHEAANVELVALFGPEHGVRGDVHAGDEVGNSVDPATGVISPDTMFNGMYAQRFMVAANEKYIGAFATGLTCASAEGNGDASVGGVRTDADLDITGRLFTVGEVEVETGDQSVPSDLGGYITLVKNGLTYKGYVKEAGFGVGKAQAVRYTLIVKEALRIEN